MLRFFRSAKRRLENREATKLDTLRWPFFDILALRLNPFRGRRFFDEIINMTAKMAIVDGAISQPELRLFLELLESHFSLSKSQVNTARKLLFQVNKSTKTFAEYAHDFYRSFRRHKALIENAFDVLLSMAYVDNILTKSEQELLGQAATAFKLSPETLQRLTNRHHNWRTKLDDEVKPKKAETRADPRFDPRRDRPQQSSSGKQNQQRQNRPPPVDPSVYKTTWASILEVDSQAPTDAVKRQYRKLVRRYHPDVLPKAVPADMLKASTERFLEIQQAYDQFCRIRGVKKLKNCGDQVQFVE